MSSYRVEKDRTTKPKRWIVRDLEAGPDPVEIGGRLWWKTFKEANGALTSWLRERATRSFIEECKENEDRLPGSEWYALWGVIRLSICLSRLDTRTYRALDRIINTVKLAERIDVLKNEMAAEVRGSDDDRKRGTDREEG